MLVKRRGRGASVQPPDVAGVAEQVVLQRVAAVAVLVIQLQTAVLVRQECPAVTKPSRGLYDRRGMRVQSAPRSPGEGWTARSNPRPHVTTEHSKRGCPETSPGITVNAHRIQDLGHRIDIKYLRKTFYSDFG